MQLNSFIEAKEIEEPDFTSFIQDPPNFNENLRKTLAFQGAISIAAMNNSLDSTEFTQELLNQLNTYSGQSPADIIKNTNARMAQLELEGIDQVVEQQLNDGDPSLKDTLSLVGEASAEITNEAVEQKPGQFENNLANMLGSSILPDVQKEIENNLYFLNSMGKLIADAGFWDKAGLLVSNQAIAMGDILDSGLFANEDALRTWINDFSSLPADEKQKSWDILKEKILKTSGIIGENPIKAVMALEKLIDPLGQRKGEMEISLGKGQAVLDASVIGGPLVRGLGSFAKYNKLRGLYKLNNLFGSKVNAAAIVDKEVAAKVGLTQEEAISQATTVDLRVLDPAHDPIMAAKSDKELANILDKLDEGMQDFPRLEVGALWEKDKEAAVQKIFKDQTEQYNIPSRITTEIADVTERDMSLVHKIGTKEGEYFRTRGNALKAKKREGLEGPVKMDENGYYIEQKDRFDFKLNDIVGDRTLADGNVGFFRRYITSPKVYLYDISPKIVDKATFSGLSSHRILTQWSKTIDKGLKRALGGNYNIPGSKANARLKRVDNILIRGDEKGVVYSPFTLKYGFKLDDQERRAYYTIRRAFDNLDFSLNQSMRRELVLRGYKHVKSVGGADGAIGKVYETSDTAFRGLGEVAEVFDTTKGQLVTLPPLHELYQEGKVLVRLPRANAHKVNNSVYEFVIASRDKVADLPDRVVNYRTGYVPKFNEKGYYAVRLYDKLELNGKRVVDREGREGIPIKTLRLARTRAEANQIVKEEKLIREKLLRYSDTGDRALRASLRNEHGVDPDAILRKYSEGKYSLSQDIRVTADREMSDIEQAYNGDGGLHGGMFTGSRSEFIGYGLENSAPKRLTAYESLIKNISNLSEFMGRNEWRVGMERRILDKYRSYLNDPSVTSLSSAVLKPGAEATEGGKSFLAAKKYMEDVMRIPGNARKRYAEIMRSMAEWTEGKPGLQGTPHDLLMSFQHKDPTTYARAIAFNTLLGWMNPSQLFVQANGATLASSMHPIYGARAASEWLFLRPLLVDIESDRTVNMVAKVPGMASKDITEYRKLFIETGLRDSIFHIADYEPVTTGIGMTARNLRKINEAGLLPYREGELFNRGVSLRIAQLKWREKNPTAVLDNKAMKEILSDTLHMSLNMFKENAAAWQHGIPGITTQFLQVHAKFAETMLGRSGISAEEARRMWLGQFLLYGSSGVPLGNWTVNSGLALAERSGIIQPGEDLPPDLVKYFRGGLPDELAYYMFGANVEAANRVAIAKGLEDTILKVFTKEGMWYDAFGAFGGTTSRFWDAFRNMSAMFISDDWSNIKDIEIDNTRLELFLESLASIPSSTSNAQKAWIWYQTGKLMARNGKVITSVKPNFSTAVALALGFQPSVQADSFGLDRDMKAREEQLMTTVDILTTLSNNYLNKIPTSDDPERDARNHQALLRMHTEGIEGEDLRFVINRLTARMRDNNTSVGKTLHKYLDVMASNLLEDVSQDVKGIRGNVRLNTLVNPNFYEDAEENK